jgi:signal transduction histidine kinase
MRTGKSVRSAIESKMIDGAKCLTPSEEDARKKRLNYQWNDFFNKEMTNPYNYLIRIYDKNSGVIWFSDNFGDSQDNDQVYKKSEFKNIADVTAKKNEAPEHLKYSNFEGMLGNKHESFYKKKIRNKDFMVYVFKTDDYVITIGQPYMYFINFKYSLLLYCGIGIVAALAIFYFFARKALAKPFEYVDDLSRKIDGLQVSSHNIELPESYSYKEYVKIESALTNAFNKINEAFSKLNRFSSDVAHELKTPLTILRGELTLALQEERDVESYMTVVSSALDEALRLSGVVDALLELARAETGQSVIIRKEGDFSAFVADIAEDCEILAEEKDIIITSNIQPLINFSFDYDRMRQAVLNIIENAIKYTKPNGIITIDLKSENRRAVLTVSDTGIGIAPENLENIFERFFRADEVKMKRISGLGLGLTMVKWIVEAHGGKVIVKSQLGKGTVFEINLPILN